MSDIVPNADASSSPDGALNDRQAALLAIVRMQGFATVEWLAERFDVSAQTIRRDIIRLDEARLLQRFHGGAGVRDGRVRLGYEEKRGLAVGAKAAIGRAAAALVPDGATVFLDVGTTVEAVARALVDHRALRVVTNSLVSALHLAGRPGIEVIVAGGTLRGADGSLVGEAATSLLRDIRFDLAFIGLSGWDTDGAPMDFDLDKVAVKRVAIARAGSSVALCDAGKFARAAVVRIAPAACFKMLVCDQAPGGDLGMRLAEQGVAIVEANQNDPSRC